MPVRGEVRIEVTINVVLMSGRCENEFLCFESCGSSGIPCCLSLVPVGRMRRPEIAPDSIGLVVHGCG